MAVCLRTSEGTLIDIPIFNLSIHQKEGLKAICDIEVANQATTFPPLIDVFIDDICQFRGQVTGYLKHFTPHTAKIQLTQLTAPYTKEPDTPIQFTTPLEHLPLLPCYNRLNGKVNYTPLIHGQEQLTLVSQNILGYTSTKHPIPIGIDLHLEAKWHWRQTSFFDLWSEVKTQCHGIFSTLTPQAFISRWHKALQFSPQSGYTTMHNHLEITSPCFSTPYNQNKRLKGGIIDGQCIIRATQEQKYHEIIQCSLGKPYEQRKKLFLQVPITEHDERHFFATEVGQAWFARAFAIAQNYFMSCNRQTRIKVETVLSSAQMAQLSTDTQITLEGKFSGKIVEYVISYTDKGCISTIVLCERATALEPETPPKLPSPSAEEAAGQSFVYDLDIQNLLEAQNAVITSKAEEPSTLPVTTVYLKLRDLRPKRLEPVVIKL